MAEERIEVGALARDVSVQVATQVANTVAAAKTNELLAASASAEASRVSAEQGRVAAEQGRVTAEQGRVAAETARAAEFAGFEDEIDSKITLGSKWRDGTGSTGHADKADNADNLIATKGLTVNDDPMSFGIVGGAQKSAVGDGNASMNKLVCVDVVRNQKIQNGNFESTNQWFIGGASGTPVFTTSNNVAHIEYTSDVSSGGLIQASSIMGGYIAGHQYYVSAKIKNNNEALNGFRIGQSYGVYATKSIEGGETATIAGIITPQTVEGTGYANLTIKGSVVSVAYNFDISNVVLIDLTQRYGNNGVVNAIIGTGTDAEKIARLLAFDPEILSDTDHDYGTMVPSKTAKLLPVGVNQWDEEVEEGYITSDGSLNNSATSIRSKNFNRLICGGTYYLKKPDNYSAGYICFYDANKNFINRRAIDNSAYTFPIEALYFKISCYNYGATYNHDICINVSDPNINGKYYKSKRNPVTLPNYEGHGILKVVDGKVVADGTELYPDGNSKKRYRTYTFTGSETWVKRSASTEMVDAYYATGVISYSERSASNSVDVITDTGLVGGDAFSGTTSGLIFASFRDVYITVPAGTNPNTVCANGKTMVYKLATEEDITTDGFQSTFPVEQGGTLQFLDENDNPIAGLQGSEIFYQKNIKAFVEALGEATDWDPERIKRLGDLSFTPEYVNIPLNPSPTGAYARAQVYNASFTIVISAALTGTPNGSITFQDSEIDLSNFQTKPADYLYDMDGKKVSEAPTTADCNIASFVGRSKSGIVLWSLLHSGVNKVKIHIEEAVPLDSDGNGKIDCRTNMIL